MASGMRLLLACAAIFLVLVGLYSAQAQVNNMTNPHGFNYDQSFIDVVKKITQHVPEGETIVVSNLAPHITYLSERKAVIPWGADSIEALASDMKKSRWNYLLVIEGRSSSVKDLQYLFSRDGRSELKEAFNEIAVHDSDLLGFHLYKLRSNS